MKAVGFFSLFLLAGLTSCAVQHSQEESGRMKEKATVRPEVWEVELLALSGQGFAPLGITDRTGLTPVGVDVTLWNAGKATFRFSCPKDSSASVHRFCEALRNDGRLEVMRLSRVE